MKTPVRHSRAGGNPARFNIPRSGQHHDVFRCAEDYFIVWIPACAGMTQIVSVR